MRRKIVKTVAFMGILAGITGLFGCKGTNRPSAGELTKISVAQSDMTAYGALFRLCLNETGGNWLFNAEYFSLKHNEYLTLDGVDISSEEAAPLLKIVEENNVIDKVRNYKPRRLPRSLQPLDGGSDHISLTFADGSEYSAGIGDSDMNAFFIELADGKYLKTAKHAVSQLTEISVSCWGGETVESSYSYSVMKSGEKWLMNAQCYVEKFTPNEREVEINDREVSEEEISGLFKIIEENSLIAYAENYENKPLLDENGEEIVVYDAENYKFTLKYSDNSEYCTKDEQQALVGFFDALIEKEEE